MPIYEYACGKCEHEFEVEQRMSDPPVKTCPECRSRKVKRLISRTSFVLKGSGWYSDLYSSAPKKGEGKSDGDEAGSKDKGSDKESPKDKGSKDKGAKDKGAKGSGSEGGSGGSKGSKASGGSQAAA